MASSARCSSGESRARTVIVFSVRVPVLSVAMTVTEPSASTAERRRTTALRDAIRSVPSASVNVRTAGRPSGTAATATATAKRRASSMRSMPSMPTPATMRITARAATQRAMRCPNWVRRRSSGVASASTPASIAGDPAHGRVRAGPRHDHPGNAPHRQRPGEDLLGDGPVDWYRLAGEHRFVHHQTLLAGQDAVGRDAVTRFHPYQVTGDELGSRDLSEARRRGGPTPAGRPAL